MVHLENPPLNCKDLLTGVALEILVLGVLWLWTNLIRKPVWKIFGNRYCCQSVLIVDHLFCSCATKEVTMMMKVCVLAMCLVVCCVAMPQNTPGDQEGSLDDLINSLFTPSPDGGAAVVTPGTPPSTNTGNQGTLSPPATTGQVR